MRAMLLGLAAPMAALAFSAAPAGAQAFVDPGFASLGASAQGVFVSDHRDGKRHDRRRHRRSGDTVVIGGFGWNDDWAVNNNRSWEHDSYNDWWHERPWRSYPRWMQSNQNCDRLWWGGGTWRCSW